LGKTIMEITPEEREKAKVKRQKAKVRAKTL
jgi:hypothetical protein